MKRIMNEVNAHVKKHADLILCSNNMTLIQRKVFNVLLYNAMPNLLTENHFKIKVTDIVKSIGYKSRNYIVIEDSINKLGDLRIKCRVIDSKTKAEDIISLNIAIIQTIYIKNGFCVYRYNDDIKKQLAYPSIYARLDLSIQATIRSSFGLILYEVCEKYKGIGHTGWIEIEKVRSLMGVGRDNYKLFADFEKRVLNPAISEVNNRTNFKVLLFKSRKGKAVDRLKFEIKSNINDDIAKNKDVAFVESNNQIVNQLIEEFNVNHKVAVNLYSEYSEKYITEKIAIVKASNSYKAGGIRNLPGSIVKAITEDYKLSMSSGDAARNNQIKKNQIEQRQKQIHKNEEELYNQYLCYRGAKVDEYIRSLSFSDCDKIKDNFIEYCKETKNMLALKNFKTLDDRDHCIVKEVFNGYIAKIELGGVIEDKTTYLLNNQYNLSTTS